MIKKETTEKCKKCGALRVITLISNGAITKKIYSIKGENCKHNWKLMEEEE